MKKIYKSILMSFMALAMASSCTEKLVEETPVIFPDKMTGIHLSEGKTEEISFTAETDWTLTSSQSWCIFLDENDKEFNTLKGTAGRHSYKVMVKTDDQKLGDISGVAQIYLAMDGQKKVFAEIVRDPLAYVFNFLDEKGEAIPQDKWVWNLTGSSEQHAFKILANFDFVVVNVPKWLRFKKRPVGKAGEIFEGEVSLNYSAPQNAVAEIVFTDASGLRYFPVTVTTPDYPDDDIKVQCKTINKQNFDVTLDGKEFHINSSSMGGGGNAPIIYKDFLKYEVISKNDDYEIVYVQQIGKEFTCSLIDTKMDCCRFDKKNSVLLVNPTETERSISVFAMPKVTYDKFDTQKWMDYMLTDGAPNTYPSGFAYVCTLNQKDLTPPDPNALVVGVTSGGSPVKFSKITSVEVQNRWTDLKGNFAGMQVDPNDMYVVKQTSRSFVVKTQGTMAGRTMLNADCTEYGNVQLKTPGIDGLHVDFSQDLTEEKGLIMIINQSNQTKAVLLLFEPNK